MECTSVTQRPHLTQKVLQYPDYQLNLREVDVRYLEKSKAGHGFLKRKEGRLSTCRSVSVESSGKTKNVVGSSTIYKCNPAMTRPPISRTIKNASTVKISHPVTSGMKIEKTRETRKHARICIKQFPHRWSSKLKKHWSIHDHSLE